MSTHNSEISPEISVILSTYYQHKDTALLQRSVESILNQTFQNFEFIIFDSGSTAKAVSVVDAYARQDARVHIVRQTGLVTLQEKLNLCLRHAKGEFVARMDDDDRAYPERFTRQITFLKQHTDTSFVGSIVRLCRDGIDIGVRTLPDEPTVRDFLFVQPYVHPTLMFRREALMAVNGYCERKRCVLCEDYDLLLRLYEAGKGGVNLQECLLDYTISSTAKGERKMRHRWNECQTRFFHFRKLGLLPGALPFVVKPLVVGFIPAPLREYMKQQTRNST